MLPYLCALLLVIPSHSKGAPLVGADDSVSPAPTRRSAHLEWLVQMKEEEKHGGDPKRRSFFEQLLDEPILESGQKKSQTTFLDALLSEPLFDNALAKAVADTRETPHPKIDIPASPQLGFLKSSDKWPEIFYPPTKYEMLERDGNRPSDFTVDTLEFFKHVDDKKEQISDGNSKKAISSVDKLESNTSLVGSVFDILENIPSIDDLMDGTLGPVQHTPTNRGDTDHSIHKKKGSIEPGKRNQANPSQSLMSTLIGTKKAGLAVARNSASIAANNKGGNRHPAEKRKILHHLIYLFPKNLKKKPSTYLKEKHKTLNVQTSHENVNKENYGQEKKSNNLKKFFLPQQQLRTHSFFKHIPYGTFFPQYTFYPLYPKSPDVKYSLNNLEDLRLFPHMRTHLMPQPIFNHIKSVGA